MSTNHGRDGIKVVIINTQYVQTDATSFKSVVQKLTGKDSKVPDSFDDCSPVSTTGGGKGTQLSWSRNLSFKEFDGLMKEVSNMEDLDYLWTE